METDQTEEVFFSGRTESDLFDEAEIDQIV